VQTLYAPEIMIIKNINNILIEKIKIFPKKKKEFFIFKKKRKSKKFKGK
jgi:hypothetical protein